MTGPLALMRNDIAPNPARWTGLDKFLALRAENVDPEINRISDRDLRYGPRFGPKPHRFAQPGLKGRETGMSRNMKGQRPDRLS